MHNLPASHLSGVLSMLGYSERTIGDTPGQKDIGIWRGTTRSARTSSER